MYMDACTHYLSCVSLCYNIQHVLLIPLYDKGWRLLHHMPWCIYHLMSISHWFAALYLSSFGCWLWPQLVLWLLSWSPPGSCCTWMSSRIWTISQPKGLLSGLFVQRLCTWMKKKSSSADMGCVILHPVACQQWINSGRLDGCVLLQIWLLLSSVL